MVELAQLTQLRIRFIYYPPYHSKYNPIVDFAFPKGTLLGGSRKLLEWGHFRVCRDGSPMGQQHDLERHIPHRPPYCLSLSQRG
jgi:hypothetical protein